MESEHFIGQEEAILITVLPNRSTMFSYVEFKVCGLILKHAGLQPTLFRFLGN